MRVHILVNLNKFFAHIIHVMLIILLLILVLVIINVLLLKLVCMFQDLERRFISHMVTDRISHFTFLCDAHLLLYVDTLTFLFRLIELIHGT